MRILRKGDLVLKEDRLNITITGNSANDAAKNLGQVYQSNREVINQAQGQGKDVDLVWQNPKASRSSAGGSSNTVAQARPTQGSGIPSAQNALIDAANDTEGRQDISVDASDIKGEGVVMTKAQLNEMLNRIRRK